MVETHEPAEYILGGTIRLMLRSGALMDRDWIGEIRTRAWEAVDKKSDYSEKGVDWSRCGARLGMIKLGNNAAICRSEPLWDLRDVMTDNSEYNRRNYAPSSTAKHYVVRFPNSTKRRATHKIGSSM